MSSYAKQFLTAAKRLGFKVCVYLSVLLLLFDFPRCVFMLMNEHVLVRSLVCG